MSSFFSSPLSASLRPPPLRLHLTFTENGSHYLEHWEELSSLSNLIVCVRDGAPFRPLFFFSLFAPSMFDYEEPGAFSSSFPFYLRGRHRVAARFY